MVIDVIVTPVISEDKYQLFLGTAQSKSRLGFKILSAN